MATPNQYPSISPATAGMNLLVWVPNQGDTRRMSLTTLLTWILGNFGTYTYTTPVTVAELPDASDYPGARAVVTDANSATFNAALAGGGANIVPVFSTGAAWKVG